MSEHPSADPRAAEHLTATRAYYDTFAARYDAPRGGRVRGGYHDLIDDLQLEFLARYATGRKVLEVGCGTGLLLERMEGFAGAARGIDLSPAMLARARERGLDVVEGSATALPFPDASFSVACAFKVLPHVLEIERALNEMVRVVEPGGYVVADFYNRWSLRYAVKRLAPAQSIGAGTTEAAVHTRFDSPRTLRRHLPSNTRIVGRRGVRIVTPAAVALRVPVVGSALQAAERRLCDTPLRQFAGFLLVALQKTR